MISSHLRMAGPKTTRMRAKARYIDAHVISLRTYATALGDRTYAVFKVADGTELGFWSYAKHPVLKPLRVGDQISLRRNDNGRLRLVDPHSNPVYLAFSRFFNI
ncbi:MAG: hypothetical protein ACFE0I_23710 [Elainellaceae cyanobacterium]